MVNAKKIAKKETFSSAKPLIKWAGGKSQLLLEIKKRYPKELGTSIRRYAEPFAGGLALFLELFSSNLIDEAFICDKNANLINLYEVVKNSPKDLIDSLEPYSKKYLEKDEDAREEFFYCNRENFNKLISNPNSCKIKKSALLIFLNKTCYNGLYRVNASGFFNVPFGKYKNPNFFTKENIYNVSSALSIAKLKCCDFSEIENWINKSKSFVYFDPPYRPLNKTSSFTAYAKSGFGDREQQGLAEFFHKITQAGNTAMLSNSDPFSFDGDRFFEDLYSKFNISRVIARRVINSKGSKRKGVKELLVTSY